MHSCKASLVTKPFSVSKRRFLAILLTNCISVADFSTGNFGDDSQTLRFFYNYDNPKQGEGFFIHTYKENGDPLKSFEGEPKKVILNGSIDEFSEKLWNALNIDNKISLAVRYIDIKTGKYEQVIKNKLEGM